LTIDVVLITAYLGVNALVWAAMYCVGRARSAYEKAGIGDRIDGVSLPRVSIVIPLYREKQGSIMRTVRSVAEQRYPRSLLEVWLVVEDGDCETIEGSRAALYYLAEKGIKASIYIARGGRSSKARSLNAVLESLEGEIVGVYDADDSFDDNQLLEAVRLMEGRGYDAVGVRVYRYGDSILGRLLYVDTVVWYDIILRFLKSSGLHVPLSGEGLYIRKKVLEEIGGFPERLAEDAYLSLLLFERGYRVGLLDSYVLEAAPATVLSHIRQRIRWYRGHLECLSRILIQGGSKRLRASISYLSPLFAAVSLLASIVAIAVMSSYIARAEGQGSQQGVGQGIASGKDLVQAYSTPVPVLVFIEGIAPLGAVALAVVGHGGPIRPRAVLPYTMLLPLYWIVVSSAALPALFLRNIEWYKTERA